MILLIIDETKMIVLNTVTEQEYEICEPTMKGGKRVVSLKGTSDYYDIYDIIGLHEELVKELFPEYYL